jgi:4-hydroxythreonine-4-phosphate dehydrogenase/1,2-dihydroxy-3,5-cyclohexadiene-1,4-dicarboxylate dehydrogenase
MPLGDPNGIGPEIALKTAAAYAGRADVALTLVGPWEVLERTAEGLGLTQVLHRTVVIRTTELPQASWRSGCIVAAAGAAAIEAASHAIRLAREGHFDAIVAGPHHETAISQAGIRFSGYPSLVAQVCAVPEDAVFLLLIGGGLRIVHVTLHESVRSALDRLTPDLVVGAAGAGLGALLRMGVARPRIAVFGVNPHAGEGGLFGREDEAIIRPAVDRLRASGLDVSGPTGADALLAAREHDLYVAIFHDQGHIPIKLLSPRRASALSVGADVILASVGHGSAMDIAGRGIASAAAMIETVALLANVAPGAASTEAAV